MLVEYTVVNSVLTKAGLDAAAVAGYTSERGIKTVLKVETGGKSTDYKGRLPMLFEPHVFYRELAFDKEKQTEAVSKKLAYPKAGTLPYPADSYPRFEAACAIDENAACRSASWGLPQIMGNNCDGCGFDTAKEMIEFMALSADNQVLCMGKLVKEQNLDDELNSQNWKGFARGWNGTGYAKNEYDEKLATAWAFFGGVDSHIVPRVAGTPLDAIKPSAFMDLPVTGPMPATKPLLISVGTDKAANPVPVPDLQPNTRLALAPADEPAAVIQPPAQLDPQPVGSDPIVLWVQTRLRELGYFEVGTADGKMGTRTTGAILSFRHDNAMPLNPAISDDLKLALIAAPPRPVDADRAAATVKTLKPASIILQTTARAKIVTWATGGFGLAASAFSGVTSNLNDANSTVGQFKALFTDVPGWVWGVMAVLVAFAAWTQLNKVETQRVKMFNSGQAT